ncbi:OsmC family protein [Nocardia xishanensis]|uniref:OsmC family protein n=1 Tax=Nocardia xishanensis TaxID=238964 RepID=UPI000A9642D1|nr:OsmC family protein [Nocardia xishanensis]
MGTAETSTIASAAPTTYTVTACSGAGAGPAVAHAGSETIALDASWGTAPSGLPGPAHLLAAALAACLLKNLARAQDLLSFGYEHAEVQVSARRQDAPPKFTEFAWEMRLVTDEPQRRLDLLHRNLTTHGTVYNTLAAACEVHGTITAVPSAS